MVRLRGSVVQTSRLLAEVVHSVIETVLSCFFLSLAYCLLECQDRLGSGGKRGREAKRGRGMKAERGRMRERKRGRKTNKKVGKTKTNKHYYT